MTPRYLMVGGFLGAGKTTALLQLAQHYRTLGQRVGLITNDQSTGLVDTALLSHHGFPVEEITGGCFCCRFNTLTEAAAKLTEANMPDLFLAEPVGSCTDLAATVSYPLRRLYGDNFTVAPYTVLIDPTRAERILGLNAGKSFSPQVVYIYRKQLEEADIIGINKIDTLTEDRLERLMEAVRTSFPKSNIITLSARTGDGIQAWAELLDAAPQDTRATMDLDYGTYADGEALLGWINLTALVEGDEFDGNEYLVSMFNEIQQVLQHSGIEIAHLKATLAPDDGADLAIANLTRGDGSVELSHSLDGGFCSGELIVNLRAEGDPDVIASLLRDMLSRDSGVRVSIGHLEAFRPGKPMPTHRDVVMK